MLGATKLSEVVLSIITGPSGVEPSSWLEPYIDLGDGEISDENSEKLRKVSSSL